MESDFIKSVRMSEYTGKDYHAEKDFISASGLKKIKVSPMHFKEAEEDKQTDAMLFGSAYHCFILEPEKFDVEYYILDDSVIYQKLILEGSKSPRSTNVYKDWVKSEACKSEGRIVIDKADFDRINAMKERLFSHSYAKMLLTGGRGEVGYTGEVETSCGVIKAKIKPDYIKDSKRIITDLKTCTGASADEFTRTAAQFDYHIQAAFYSDLMRHITGSDGPYTFIFIAQEKTAPFAFNIFEASPQFIAQGRYEYELLLQTYQQCKENNSWPGYDIWIQNKYGIQELNLPAYAIKSIDYYDHSA